MIQTTNIRRILDRVMRHPMMRDIPFESAVEYTVDFLQLMGTPALYDEKTAIVEVSNWRGELPCDFYQMIQVRIAPSQRNGSFFTGMPPVYRYSGHSFHMSDSKPANGGLTYKIQGMVIFTSTKDTDLEIAYRAFAVDEEGYPLLPDNTSFLRGLENYIKVQWFTILFDMGKINLAVLQNAQSEYAWAAGDAYAEFSRLDLDKAETLFNSFATLLPRNNEHWKGFFTNGSKELWIGGSRKGVEFRSGGNMYVTGLRLDGIEGGGGDTPTPTPTPPTPTPTELDYPIYYGGQSTELPIDSSTANVIRQWDSTTSYTTSGIYCGEIWYYLAIHTSYSIVSIITDNTEPITSMFELKGRYVQDGKSYNLYEFHLSSDMPLDVNFTLVVK